MVKGRSVDQSARSSIRTWDACGHACKANLVVLHALMRMCSCLLVEHDLYLTSSCMVLGGVVADAIKSRSCGDALGRRLCFFGRRLPIRSSRKARVESTASPIVGCSRYCQRIVIGCWKVVIAVMSSPSGCSRHCGKSSCHERR